MRYAVAEAARRRALVDPLKPALEQKSTDYAKYKDDTMPWLWGRRMLLIGDSVDRYLTQFFCEEFGRPFRAEGMGPRTYAMCNIPEFNLTVMQWHFSGSWTYRPNWWWMDDMAVVSFEERWEKYFTPTVDKYLKGQNGKGPDLILWQNGLWDQRALWEAGEAHFGKASENETDYVMGSRDRQLAFDEVRFIAARISKFVNKIASTFGADTPTMFRAITMHRTSEANDANLYDIDRIGRTVGNRAGHETFEWGRIISAHSWLYKDKTHAGKGAASWLWGNMAIEYLARAAGKGGAPYFEGWSKCHRQLTTWGGR